MFINILILQISFVLWSYRSANVRASNSNVKSTPLIEISVKNITDNLVDWDQDLAIMFYAPWCTHCKSLASSWAQISILKQKSPSKSSLVVGKFNCELNTQNGEFCQQFGVDRYPSIFYIGYGPMYQNHGAQSAKKASILQRSTPEVRNRIVRFNADIYVEGLYDWINMLSFISTTQRKYDDFVGFLTGTSRYSKKVERLQDRIAVLDNKIGVFSEALEKYKADELFDTLEYRGDPFPILSSAAPDEKNLPFRACIADMVSEFCKYYQNEKYCHIASDCKALDLEPAECRPQKCPFESQRGCVVASVCLDVDILKSYKDALAA